MKLKLKNTDNWVTERINIFEKDIPCLDSNWHYHPQYELLYITKSSGIRFVGDSVSQFYPGDLVLVGGFLPHLWRNDTSYYENDSLLSVRTIVMKFMSDFIGKDVFENIEFLEIKNMLELSKYGIDFGRKTSERLHDEIVNIVNLSRAEQSIRLLSILNELSLSEVKTPLSSADMRQYSSVSSDRVNVVIKFISDNYSNQICLKDVADIACMTTNSFCRFFKKMTNKSFTQFLNEVRIRNAARILVQEDIGVYEVCFKVGYQSMTNFYRQFKNITGTTPKEYRTSI